MPNYEQLSKCERRPTIKDVARAARVSTATVSRAMNDPRLLRDETLVRVRDAVRDCQYEPNHHALELARKASTERRVLRGCGEFPSHPH